MASLNFDASTIDTTSRDPIKPGTYEAVITESEIRATKSGNGKGINLTFEILSQEAKGRKVWAWINYQHPKQEAQRIGQEELARICKAVGVEKLQDTAQLHNLPLLITVALDKNDPTRNVIKGYKAKAAQPSGGGAQGASGSGDAPWAR